MKTRKHKSKRVGKLARTQNQRKVKDTFLILRMETSLKLALVAKAKEEGKTVSDFVRDIISPKV